MKNHDENKAQAFNPVALNFNLAHEAETIRFGHSLATTLLHPEKNPFSCPAPAVFLLYGDLGSGKTTFARGFTAALPGGEQAEVSSPSFTICNMYPTRPLLVHCDLYRLPEGAATLPEEAEDALEQGGLVLVEWAERLAPQDLPSERLDIVLQSCKGKRLATVHAHGVAACLLLHELARHWSPVDSPVTAKD